MLVKKNIYFNDSIKFNFGRYNNVDIAEVAKTNPSYLYWFIDSFINDENKEKSSLANNIYLWLHTNSFFNFYKSKYVGNVNDKLTNIRVSFIEAREKDETIIATFMDDNNNMYRYYIHNYTAAHEFISKMKVGSMLCIKRASIIGYSENNGIKFTILTRAKLDSIN